MGALVTMIPRDWREHVTAYVAWLHAGGCAPTTIRLREHYVARVALRSPCPTLITPADLIDLLACDTWTPETRRSARASVCSFFAWAQESGLRADNPAAHLPRVRVPQAQPRPATEEALYAALETADARSRLMLLLAAYAGLRCAEIARVHTDDVYHGELRVKGKGGKVRRVPLHPVLMDALPMSGGWVFPNGKGDHVTAGHVTRLLSDALGEGTTGHQLRHLFACRVYAQDRDILAVRELLGHASVATTQRYTQTPLDALRSAVGGLAAPPPRSHGMTRMGVLAG